MSLKNIYLIVGPSGSGKTTIASVLEKAFGLKAVESYTTRPPRYEGERGHIFVSDEEFDALGPMCAYTEYNGYRYGVTEDIIDSHDLYVIDPAGVNYMRSIDGYQGSKKVITIRLEVDREQRFQRMTARGDDDKTIINRLINDYKSFGPEEDDIRYDMVIPNNDIVETVETIWHFIQCWEGE